MLKDPSKNQFPNSKKTMILALANILCIMQEHLALEWVNVNYFQIDPSLNKPARYI